MRKFRPLQEPIKLQDLLNFARSRAEKKINSNITIIFVFQFREQLAEKHRHFSNYGTSGTLRYEDGKARMVTAVDAGNFRGSRCVTKDKMLKMCTFVKDSDVNNLSFVKAIHKSNNFL